MTRGGEKYDVIVIGSGPAGQKGAIQAAKAGCRVAMVEQAGDVGGECVRRGTIPSKSLRETAIQYLNLKRNSDWLEMQMPDAVPVAGLINRLHHVVGSHVVTMQDQLRRNGVVLHHGKGRLISPRQVEVLSLAGEKTTLSAEILLLATGSRPRQPPELPLDHEHVLDSDSILSMAYLPSSLTVLGAGVIACEYASSFAHLGVEVTIIDRGPRLVGVLDDQAALAGGEAVGLHDEREAEGCFLHEGTGVVDRAA
ncbi:MAG: FAD-dependent oxidoreductase, partial [Acidobacteriota bacterium]